MNMQGGLYKDMAHHPSLNTLILYLSLISLFHFPLKGFHGWNSAQRDIQIEVKFYASSIPFSSPSFFHFPCLTAAAGLLNEPQAQSTGALAELLSRPAKLAPTAAAPENLLAGHFC